MAEYIGKVVDNKDPSGRGRVRIRVLSKSDDETSIPTENLEWYSQFGGHLSGTIKDIPRIDDIVAVTVSSDMSAFFYHTNMILRKEVVEILKNEDDPSQAHIIYYDENAKFYKNKDKTFLSNGGASVSITDDSVSLTGKNIILSKDSEPAVKGDTLKSILGELCDALRSLTVTCSSPGSPSTIPVNAAKFIEIKSKLDNILSKNVHLE